MKHALIPLLITGFFIAGCTTRKSIYETIPRVEFSFEDFYPDGGIESESLEVQNIPQKVLNEELKKVEQALKGRLAHFGLILEPEEEIEIAKWYYYYTTRGRERAIRALQRGAPYYKSMLKIIKSYGLPEDLIYLPIIESGFNLYAVSRKKATGPWQFMSYTAKKYGLIVDWWIDHRLDPIYSTHAACKYLKELYEIFERWDLAIAAYNAGEGKIYSRLVRTNGEKFWDIRRQLKKETRNYVPSFLAVIMFVNDNRELVDSIINNSPLFEYDSVMVPYQANIKQLASWAGISESEFRYYNPSLNRFATPPYLKNYYVRIPKGKAETFLTNMNNTPKDQWFRAEVHVVKKGETPSTIARKYRVSTNALLQVNNIRDPRTLRPGQVLIIPYGPSAPYQTIPYQKTSNTKATTPKNSGEASNNSKGVKYRVQPGDTLFSIARRYNVTVAQIKKWNSLNSDKIRSGQTLTIYLN